MSNYSTAGLAVDGSNFRESSIEILKDHGVIFPVRIEDVVSAQSGLDFNDRMMLINSDLNIPIGLVSRSYQILENAKIFDSFLSAVERADVSTDNVRILPTTSDFGSKTMAKFRFLDEEVKLPFDDSPIAYELSVSNSFDGTQSYMTRVSGFRLICSNGLMMAKTLGQKTHWHRSVLDIDESSRSIVHMLSTFKNADRYWQAMVNIEMSDEAVERAIRKYFGYGDAIDVMEYTQSSACAHVVRCWKQYSNQFGSNLYALYQALTDFVSNKQYKVETMSTGMGFNETRLQKFLGSYPAFKQAANDSFREAA